jgi:hypothetical protein
MRCTAFIVSVFCLLVQGCSLTTPAPPKLLVIPPYPGAHIRAHDPKAPAATPGFTYDKTTIETPDPPEVILTWYAEAMVAEGWQPQMVMNSSTSARYTNPAGCDLRQDAWIVIVSATPGSTWVELDLEHSACRK